MGMVLPSGDNFRSRGATPSSVFAIIKGAFLLPPPLPTAILFAIHCVCTSVSRRPRQRVSPAYNDALPACGVTEKSANISRKDSMKKIKDYSDEDDYEVDDPDYPEVEGASEEEWTPEAGTEAGTKIRPQRGGAKKRQHSEEEDEEEEDEFEEDEEEEDEESDSDTGKKSKRKRRSKKDDDEKEDEEDEDSDDNSYNESGETPKEYTSGSFVLAKADLESNKNKEDNLSSKGKSDVESNSYPTLWRIDGKALLQKFLPFEEDGKVLYKSTTTYSGWQQSNKDNYIAVQVSFKVQSRQETIVELHFDPSQPQEVKDDKED